MAAFNKFQDFVEQLLKGKHNFDAAGDVFKVYASEELLALGPAYQWVDDVELRAEPALGSCP